MKKSFLHLTLTMFMVLGFFPIISQMNLLAQVAGYHVPTNPEETKVFWDKEKLANTPHHPMPILESGTEVQSKKESKYELADTDKSPAGDMGALHFSMYESNTSKCSASAVGKRLVLTAAHCAKSDTSLFSNIVFYPRYWGNRTNPWNYPIEYVIYFNDYKEKSVPYHDMALLITSDDMSGQIDYLDVDTEFEPEQGAKIDLYGYPSGLDYGNRLYEESDYLGSWTSNSLTVQSAWVKNLQLGTRGASGGPWLNSKNEVIGVNSCITLKTNTLHSISLGGGTASPYNILYNTAEKVLSGIEYAEEEGLYKLSMYSMNGTKELRDGDKILMTEVKGACEADEIQFSIELDNGVTWWKGLYLGKSKELGIKDKQKAKVVTISWKSFQKNHLVLWKAKIGNNYDPMYCIMDAQAFMKPGNKYIFTWQQD